MTTDVRDRLTSADLLRANLPARYWRGVKLSNIPETAPYLGDVTRYIDRIGEFLDAGIGLTLFSSENGTGKTAIASMAIRAALMHRKSAFFVRAATLQDSKIRDVVAPDSDEYLMDRAASVELLVIDDFGKEHQAHSGFTVTLMEDLLRGRVQQARATIITTNLTPKEFRTVYSVDLAQAVKEALIPVHVVGEAHGGKDWREEAAKRNHQMLRGG